MKAWITLGTTAVALGALTACGSEYDLQHTPGPEAAPVAELERHGATELSAPPRQAVVPGAPAIRTATAEPVPQWSDVPSPGGATTRLRQLADDPSQHEQTFRFGGDAPTLTDVLFVVDGSVSMGPLVDKLRAGMGELAKEGVFPAGTRIAVTNMTPRNMAGTAPFRGVRARHLAAVEPGFAGLVSESTLARAREALAGDERYGHQFDLQGCDPWFEPTATSSDGTACLVAHTQILEAPTGIEAGLVSVLQVAMRDGELFRPGAAANVVFVSDTHGPGVPSTHDDYATLSAAPADRMAEFLTQSLDAPVSSMRLHAIAPTDGCTSERFAAPVYHEAAEASGGHWLDICSATPKDYVDLMRHIAVDGSRPQQAVLPLSAEAATVESVLVNGQPVGFSFGGRTLVLDGEVPARAANVQVRFRAAPTTRTRVR